MKIKDIVCDICGESCEWHGSYVYTIRKRFWEMEVLGRRVDLCQDCWKKMQEWIIKEKFKERQKEKEFQRSEHEYTMEEFMYGQEMGNPEDGSL